ncbi:serine hydrolase domain-containing protein [Sphingosinicella microcystinivorans]|uniref:serine hydrolase domain-containing protein n=1 Tax=Sphingosinicella microcystinivorans TaxID=335406 RepID=UPI0022F3E56D|nr:serine hydrolase [Sphingosinicella microcystinivorans]WBX84532.1 serine hydrolase [Sphingosinicella microcystinivorans]
MKRYRWLLALLGAVLAPASGASAPLLDAADTVAGIPRAALDSFAETEVYGRLAGSRAPGAMIVVVDRQGNRYERAFGTLGPKDGTPLDTRRHLFHIASETKVITALGILQLAEAGRLSLDDDIETRLGGLRLKPEGGAPITIRHLLQHRAGIGNIPMVGSGLRDTRDHPPLETYLAEHAPKRLRPPGREIAYTNGAYTLLGRIIETASGEPYEHYIASRIFEPLGMTFARFPGTAAAPAPIAQGLFVSPGGTTAFPAVDTTTRPSGDAMMTAHEIGSFLVMMLNGGRYQGRQVIGGKALDTLYNDCWSADPVFGGRCLGPTRILRGGTPIYLHGGDYITSLSGWYILPEQGVALWVGNTSSVPIDDGVFEAFLKRFHPALAAVHAPKGTGPVESDLGGTYRINSQTMSASGRFFELLMPGSEYSVETRADGISVNGRRYVRIGPDLFRAPGPPAIDGDTLRFRRDGDGRVFAFHSNARSATKIDAAGSAHVARAVFGITIAALAALFLFAAVRTALAFRRDTPKALPALAAITGLLFVAGTLAALSLPAAGPFVMFGFPTLFRAAQALWALGGVAAVAMCITLVRVLARPMDRAAGIAVVVSAALFMAMLVRWEFL